MTTPEVPPKRQQLRTFVTSPGSWTLVLLLVFAALFVVAIAMDHKVIGRFAEITFSRGVITFIITLATVAIAFVLIYSALYADESSDDRFRRAREVFTALTGILGTIVGFYFGSTGTGANGAALADLKADSAGVRTLATGAAPFMYTVKVGDSTVAAGTSPDGWVAFAPPPALAGRRLTVDITDAVGRRASKTIQLAARDTTTTRPPVK